jgi:hypothetical protein
MPQFVQADLDPLWLRVLSHSTRKFLHLCVEFQYVPDSQSNITTPLFGWIHDCIGPVEASSVEVYRPVLQV